MKNLTKRILVITLITSLFIACSGEKKRNDNFLPPLKISIADEIKGDTELVEVIKSSEKALNEFSDNIEQLAIEGKDVLNKKDEDQTLMDGLKAGKLMVQFVSNSAKMAKLMEEFDTYMNTRKTQGLINDTQLKALEQVGTAFQKRINQINEKYKNYFN
ncbi:hypothetical protein [Lutibacter sp.]|uniref:hypothetical protein n=1 Tax=Lutibacter sp. TaxID=1925666 RepID=UPI0025C0BA2E|nr:hypothetical protein [Lutibacter sp.]MCF6181541.1 hypothetical protein [Lutibacter sp.]